MATNRQDTLDPALLRPGRLDRKIEFPMPDRRQKRLVFSTVTAKMNLSDEIDLEDYVSRPEKISCAEISSICQEVYSSEMGFFIYPPFLQAGMYAVRENRYMVLNKDFNKAYKQVVKKDSDKFEFYN
jgi:26S proteasome regulatory subunit T3